VAAQDAVELGAEPLDAAPALRIEKMRAELDGDAVQFLERVAEQHQLRFGVERAALNAFAIPGAADFDATMRRLDVEIVGHADRFAVLEHAKRQPRPDLLQAEAAVDLARYFIGRRDVRVPELPQLAVFHRLDQAGRVFGCERRDRDVLATQRDRFDPAHAASSSRRPSHASRSARARRAIHCFRSWRGASVSGGNRPKLTFIGWNVAASAPPVTWRSSPPSAVVSGGGANASSSNSAAAKRPASRPMAALST